jgi:hypothetical protein
MSAYMYITLSLLLYPVIGYYLVRLTKAKPFLGKLMVRTLTITSVLIVLFGLAHTITISQNLNWFLITSVYLTISILLWLTQFSGNRVIKKLGKGIRMLSFGFGYLAATLGFFFIMIVSLQLDTDQRKWLTDDLIYKERNIGQGPDPSLRLKEVEVFQRVKWFPLLATRIIAKTYDDWDGLLGKQLDVSYSQSDETLYLQSFIHGGKTTPWKDAISLAGKHH